MFGPWRVMWKWLSGRHPNSLIKRPKLNFLTIHYIYMLSLTIVGSILIYPVRSITYVDALFFASGAATQSGLNTVDVNKLRTYQQVLIYLIAMIANPIFIHSMVVFVRLHWFRKRFRRLVDESRNFRRTRSRMRTESRDERDPGREEHGVNGRDITVLRQDRQSSQENGQVEDGSVSVDKGSHAVTPGSTVASSEGSVDAPPEKVSSTNHAYPSPGLHRNITFADEIKPINGEHADARVPEQRDTEHHIAFLENQRNPKDKGTLRIPGPRDFDLGHGPQTLEEEGEHGAALSRKITSAEEPPLTPAEVHGGHYQANGQAVEFNEDDHHVKRNVTIDEPDRPERKSLNFLSRLKSRKGGSNDNDGEPSPDTAFTSGLNRLRTRAQTFSSFKTSQARDPMPYLSWQPTIGRNSAFVDLTEEQREELGGVEYRSLKTLAIILVAYFIGFHLFSITCLLPWIKLTRRYRSVVEGDGQSPIWWGIFTPASLFNDLGFTLTPDSMISFQDAVLPLILGSFLIVIGNTGFPCMLRFVIWLLSLFAPQDSGLWEELRFLLDHPRRCFTLLFPGRATWWLFWILVLLNATDLVLFIILDINDSTVTSLAPGIRVLIGWFQATSTRTAGFSCVNLAELHPAVQVSYLIMMYISVFPIAISVRRTNVYEEKSLGIYGNTEDADDANEPSYVGAHLRKQLSFDLWYIFLGLFAITIAEGPRLQNTNEFAFTTFSALFEIVSAYGTVGLSLGYPNVNASFSSQFTVVSKLVIIAMQIRGRHRGLPYELDRA
ncbi:MAG: low affinity potassium transporter, partial [Sclerophora amabilis]